MLFFPRSGLTVRIWHIQSTPLIISPNVVAVAEAFSRTKPTSAGNSKSVFTLFTLANPESGIGFVYEIHCCVLDFAILLQQSALPRKIVKTAVIRYKNSV